MSFKVLQDGHAMTACFNSFKAIGGSFLVTGGSFNL
jgi:hypothetical protein